jgi:hypothetical protein
MHLRRHAVGYLALFVALSGTTYAAVNLPNRSITGKKIAGDRSEELEAVGAAGVSLACRAARGSGVDVLVSTRTAAA